MKKILLVEIPLSICVSYTIISMLNNTLLYMDGIKVAGIYNSYMMILWCTIAVVTIYGQKLLTRWSPLLVLLIQYIFSTSMIVLTIYVSGLFMTLHPDAYTDGIRSYSVFFILGAIVYYLFMYLDAKSQNDLLQDIKAGR